MNILANVANVLIIIVIIGYGWTKADLRNWKISIEDKFANSSSSYSYITSSKPPSKLFTCNSTTLCGKGGFMPFGVDGIFKSVINGMYAYIGK